TITQAAIAQAKTIADLSRASSASLSVSHSGRHIRESVARPVPSANTQRIGFQLAVQSAVKIFIDHEGWYRVTQPQLVAAGLSANVDARFLHLYAEGIEQPIRITGPGGNFGPASAIEFYGTAIDTPYSGERVYWLAVAAVPGLRIPDVGAMGSPGPPEQSFIQ